MEVGGALSEESAVLGATFLRSPVPLEAFLDDGGVFTVVVGVHLHVRRADVHFVTILLEKGQQVSTESKPVNSLDNQ